MKVFLYDKKYGESRPKIYWSEDKAKHKVECQRSVDKCELCIYIVLLVFLCFVFVVDVNNIVLMLLLGQPKK